MKTFLTTIASFFILSVTFSQSAPGIQWQKVYGGSVADYRSYSVDTTNNGGSIIAGAYAYSFNVASPYTPDPYTDGFLIRFDASHNVVWKKNYPGNVATTFNSVSHTSDGGFIATGSINNDVINGGFSTYNDTLLVVKTDANGNTLWQKNLSYNQSPMFIAGNCVIQAKDGNYVVAGGVYNQAGFGTGIVVKLNANGDTLWSKLYSVSSLVSINFNSIKQTPDGGYILAGSYWNDGPADTTTFGFFDFYILKIDASGNEQWNKKYGGSKYDAAHSIDLTPDGGYIIAGQTQSNDGEVTSNHGGYDYWVVKTDGSGTLQWQKALGGSQDEAAFAISTTTDGNYIVTGGSSSSDGDVIGHHSGATPQADAWTAKLGNTGNIIWQNSTGSVNSEGARSIIPTSTGYIFTGTNNSKNYTAGTTAGDYWLVSLDAGGNTTSQVIDSASGGYNFATSVLQAADNGYVAAGYGNSDNHDVTGNHGSYDGWIIKTDNNGTLQWSKALGGSSADYISCVVKTSDGAYIAAGTTSSTDGDVTTNNGKSDFWVVKLSSAGSIQWQKSYGGSGFDSATSIQQTTDGGYIVAGRTSSNNGNVTGNHGGYDVWIIKLDASGNLTWQKTYGGTGNEVMYSIKQTTDGGYVAAGISNSADGDVTGVHSTYNLNDFWIIKLNASGTLVWGKSLGGSLDDYGRSIVQTTDGGYLAVGFTSSTDGDVTGNHGGSDIWVTKLDASGNLIWQKTYGGSGNEDAYSIIQTNNGNYVVAGYSSSNDSMVTGNHGNNDYWIIKIDTIGKLVWEKSLGGSLYDEAYAIAPTADNGYILGGYTTLHDGDVTNNVGVYNYWLVKLVADVLPVSLLNFDGVIKNNAAWLTWRTALEINNKGFEVQKSYDGQNFNTIDFVTGAVTSSLINTYNYTDVKVVSGSNYYRLKQMDIDGNFTYSAAIKLDYSKFGWSILGNPVIKNTTVELQLDKQANVSLQLLTINGNVLQIINKGIIDKGTYSIPLDMSNQVAGAYIIRLLVNGKQYSQKIIKN